MKPKLAAGTIPRSAAFTLIELVLVLTIISILVGGGIYYLMGNVDVAKETRVETDITTIATQLKLYESRNVQPPSEEQGLMALVEKPTTDPKPDRWTQLMEEVPLDPWKRPYQYRNPSKRSKRDYDIFSLGKDGIESEDDIGNWKGAVAQN
ncbi:MAG: type II secretion system major pseudopilin GspG [Verrucomicrobiota bacterium]